MKKLVAFACAALLLAGCGSSSEPKKETKTCTMEESGIKMSIKMDAEDDIIKKMEMTYVFPGSMLGGDISTLKEDDMKKMGDTVLSTLGISEGEGITAVFKAEGKDLKATLNIDLSKADASILKNQFKMEGNTKNIKLSETVKSGETDGAVCK